MRPIACILVRIDARRVWVCSTLVLLPLAAVRLGQARQDRLVQVEIEADTCTRVSDCTFLVRRGLSC